MLLWIIAVVVVCLLFYHVVQDLYLIYVCKLPPGPLSLPLIGNVHLLSARLPHRSLDRVVEKYGKIISFRLGIMGRAVFLQDIKHINQLFDSPYAHDRPDMPAFEKLNSGVDGIGSCNYDDRWKLMTKTLHKGLATLCTNRVETVAMHAYEQVFQKFSESSKSEGPYSPRMHMIAACSAMFSSLVYGIEPETLDSPELKTRIHCHSMLMSVLNPSHPLNMFPALWKLPLPFKTKLKTCIQDRDDLFNASYDSHVENHTGEVKDIIDIIANFELHREPEDDHVTKNDMFLSAWTLYLAGCDTLTDTTLWMVLYVCVYTDIQEKMREEIDAVMADDDSSILDKKSKLHYTRAAILEVIRLASPVTMGLPSLVKQDLKIDNYTIPQGTMVFPNQWNVHHNSDYWPDPFQFKPERFLDSNGELLNTYYIFQKMPFIPFSRGKRPCIGQYVALDLLLICFTAMLHRFRICLPKGYEPDLTGNVLFNLRPNDFPIELECIQR